MDKSRGGPNGTGTPETAVEVRTLADLARVAGVSAGTVSRALAGKSLVNIETRERIQVLARQYGFRPNQIASKLRSGRTGVIGVVIPLGPATGQPISDPFFMAILGHLADELTGSGYDIMLSRAIPDGTPDWLERITGSGMVDGVLLIGQSDQCAIIEQVAARYRPRRLGQPGQGPAPHHRGHGQRTGRTARGGASDRLRARRLAFVGDTAGVEIATRLKGARAAAQAAGLTIDHIPADLADERMRSQIGAALIASGADYDGIVAASDVIAMATLHVLHEAGRKVPGDIQLVGFDDLPMAGLTSPR
ncbi:LacI family DNA-binding transcriptional regulator [Novosphingobium panipatense]|uniref:LacI family DNA-binding transcriptional regulator n=1 Tax=Novosphingobium panipatense TaxID=428991 RepID=UPI00361BF6F3